MSWTDNENFEEYEIKETRLLKDPGLWQADLEHDLRVQWPRGEGPQPRKGQVVRLFGDVLDPWGLQGIVVGKNFDALAAGNGKVVFYRTDEEHAAYLEEKGVAAYNEAKRVYELRKDELEERRKLLPVVLQENLTQHRAHASKEGTEEQYLAFDYEIDIVKYEHAYMLYLTVGSEASLGTFESLPTQVKMGSVWHHMGEARLEELEKLIADHPDREDLPVQRSMLTEFVERGFYTEHHPEVLAEIFQATRALLSEKSLLS